MHLRPAASLQVTCVVAFPHPAVGRQVATYRPQGLAHFLHRIAPARTFGFVGEAGSMRRAGLIRGASLGTALVFGPGGVLNDEGLRFGDEPARHKLLDALGDLALLGGALAADVRLIRPGHRHLLAALRQARAGGQLVYQGAP